MTVWPSQQERSEILRVRFVAARRAVEWRREIAWRTRARMVRRQINPFLARYEWRGRAA